MLGVYRRCLQEICSPPGSLSISIMLDVYRRCLQEVCSTPVLTVLSSCLFRRLFGVTGNCAACSKLIPAFEMVMRAKENVYHLDCFACQLCNQRFCVGDKFFLKNNMILCQTDYEEGLMKEGYAPQVR
ncbi:LIM domain only protein 3-like [Oncorhynchus clarkii lewisi]|uniref:LIM domain only protein 3-like n=1 Tax=Oncorhynchus clarkii lewisi TaxID=490388 RepID=UPI0039B950BE